MTDELSGSKRKVCLFARRSIDNFRKEADPYKRAKLLVELERMVGKAHLTPELFLEVADLLFGAMLEDSVGVQRTAAHCFGQFSWPGEVGFTDKLVQLCARILATCKDCIVQNLLGQALLKEPFGVEYAWPALNTPVKA